MNQEPMVSVIIPAYNAREFLPYTLDSLESQTWTDFEIIVIDDGSTDDTAAYLAGLTYDRLRLEPNSTNLGIAATRNRGLALARGRYIAWLDADDVALPNRLEQQVKYLEHHPEAVLCCTNVRSIDRQGQVISKPWWKNGTQPLEWELCWTNPIAQSSVMVRRTAIDGLRYEQSQVPAEDYEFWTKLVPLGRLVRLPEVLVHYRILPSSAFHSAQNRATESALYSNRRFIESQLGVLPCFHDRLTSFHWAPWTPSESVNFDEVWYWGNSVLDAFSSDWTGHEIRAAQQDLRERLFRFFFAPESTPPSRQALGFYGRYPKLFIVYILKRFLRAVRGFVH